MATNPRFPDDPRRPRLVEREPEVSKPFPALLVAAILTILVAIGIAWYFFH